MIKWTPLKLSPSPCGQDLTSTAIFHPLGIKSHPYKYKGCGGGPCHITISIAGQCPAKHMWILEDENMLLNTSPGITVHTGCCVLTRMRKHRLSGYSQKRDQNKFVSMWINPQCTFQVCPKAGLHIQPSVIMSSRETWITWTPCWYHINPLNQWHHANRSYTHSGDRWVFLGWRYTLCPFRVPPC